MLQWAAVGYTVLQCVAVTRKTKNNQAHQELLGVLVKVGDHVVCCSVLQYVAVRYSVMPCVVLCCRVLQCVAVCCSVW